MTEQHELMELWKRIGREKLGSYILTAKEWNEVYEAIARAQSEYETLKRATDVLIQRMQYAFR